MKLATETFKPSEPLNSATDTKIANDKSPKEQADAVTGYYESDDIIYLRDALLNRAGYKIRSSDNLIVRADDNIVGYRTYFLPPINKTHGFDGLKESICVALLDNTANKQIIFAYKMDKIQHWVTGHVSIINFGQIEFMIHDSARFYQEKNDVETELEKFFDCTEAHLQVFLDAPDRIKYCQENKQIIKQILLARGKQKIQFKNSSRSKIYTIQGGNTYCGGYTTRLMVNIALNPVQDIKQEAIWSCNNKNDKALRKEDAEIVTVYNPGKIKKFATRSQGDEYLRSRKHVELTAKEQEEHAKTISEIEQRMEEIDDAALMKIANDLEKIGNEDPRATKAIFVKLYQENQQVLPIKRLLELFLKPLVLSAGGVTTEIQLKGNFISLCFDFVLLAKKMFTVKNDIQADSALSGTVSSPVVYLNLGGSGVSDLDIDKIIDRVKRNPHIVGLSLNKKTRLIYGGDENSSSFSENLKQSSQKIEENMLSSQGIIKLASLVQLRYLSLCGNPIETRVIQAFSKMPNLTELWVVDCNIKEEAAKYFLEFPRLTVLHDEHNKSNDVLTDEINKVLEKNRASQDLMYKEKLFKRKSEKMITDAIDCDNVEQLLMPITKHGVNTRLGEQGCSPLGYCVDQKAIKCLHFLLKRGARLEDHERNYTALFKSSENIAFEILQLLLKHGANITGEFDFNKETSLSITAFKFCHSFLNFLLEVDFESFILKRLRKEAEELAKDPAHAEFFKKNSIDSILNKKKEEGYCTTGIRAVIEFKDRIINHWHKLRECGVPLWIAFGETTDLSIDYTESCLILYQYIKKEYILFLSANELVKINQLQKLIDVYNLILSKRKILEEIPPSTVKDEEATDIEDNIEHVHSIQPLVDFDLPVSVMTKEKIDIEIDKLNQELKQKTEAEIDWKKYPKFYIAEYRGIHYYRKYFTKAQRADHRNTIHLNRIAPAPAVYNKVGSTPVRHQLTRESEVEKARIQTQDVFRQFQNSGPAIQYWGGKEQIFANQSDMLQQRMSNSYGGFMSDINDQIHSSTRMLYDKKLIGYPHYAASDLPFHALKYACGQKKLEDLTEWRLRPIFQADGSLLHPYPGKVFISLFSPLELYNYSARSVIGKHNRKKLLLLGTVAPERETSIPGGIGAEIPFYEELLEFPTFLGEYQNSYLEKFGISIELFTKYKQEIAASWDGSAEERKIKRKKVKKKIIELTLISHKERKLLVVAQKEAIRRGGYLIYKHEDGQYGLEPEGVRLASKKNKLITTVREKKLLLDVADERFMQDKSKDAINPQAALELNASASSVAPWEDVKGFKRKKIITPANTSSNNPKSDLTMSKKSNNKEKELEDVKEKSEVADQDVHSVDMAKSKKTRKISDIKLEKDQWDGIKKCRLSVEEIERIRCAREAAEKVIKEEYLRAAIICDSSKITQGEPPAGATASSIPKATK